MPSPVVLVDKEEGIATVTLNRPEAMNALSSELMATMKEAFASLRDDTSIGVAIVTGAGKAFCAGLDLKELSEGGSLFGKSESGNKTESDITTMLREFGRPVIGAINGPAITGGFELALACDMIIATPNARFADTHSRVGVIPGAGLSQKLSRVIGIYRAKEVSLTGNFISAEQAEAWGLVNRVVDPSELLPTCRKLAGEILSCPRSMILEYKKLIDDGFKLPYGEGLSLERKTHNTHFQTVEVDDIAQRREGVLNRGRQQKH